MRITVLLFGLLIGHFCQSQIDVHSYQIDLEVTDSSDYILATNTILVEFVETCSSFKLDLVSSNKNGLGMEVFEVLEQGKPIKFEHTDNHLVLHSINGKMGQKSTYHIAYGGIPIDGLVIGKNKFNQRTFFGDNWPNRAHNWFPCVDHPSDKATVSYKITAPDHYQCIANGTFKGRAKSGKRKATTIYQSEIPLPTKVMVVGIADFAKQEIPNEHGFPHTIWAYKEDQLNGFNDMQVAQDPLDFFIETVGAYPFEKLANVQSTTRFGGMENASCIFYDENAVTGKNTMENLIAHEIAHQWFGNSATESDWSHLWLSEGFATYFTSLHLEHKYGRSAMNQQLTKDRDRVIRFSRANIVPVIDTVSTDLMYLLNPNAYQKGCWVLHMLRHEIGDERFFKVIRDYYEAFKFSNAHSNDFISVVEEVSGLEMDTFFDQWLKRTGQPKIKAWVEDNKLYIEQKQEEPAFTFSLEVEFELNDGTKLLKSFWVNERSKTFSLNNSQLIQDFYLDPNVNLLYENVD